MNTPILSIIIAAHNCEETIDATFKSLINALETALHRVEIIIINDASEDSTAEKINSLSLTFPQVLTSHVNFKNIGQVRQHGVMLSRGYYITMLDSDDLLKAASLPSIINFLNESQPDMLLTRLHEIWDVKKIDHKWSGLMPEKITQQQAITRFLVHKDLQAHLIGQFIKRDIYLDHKIPAMTCYEDFYVFPEMLMAAQEIFFQKDSHYYYIKRAGSLSNALDHEKIENLITCTLKMETIFPAIFYQLILCHWLDIYIKHYQKIEDNRMLSIIKSKTERTISAKFFLSPMVRFSYKRKAMSFLIKNFSVSQSI